MLFEAGEEWREDVGKEGGGKVRRRGKRIEDCHLLSARNRHSLQNSLPIVSLAPAHMCSLPNHEAKCTSSRTITTSILNKITPPVPVWLMGRVWEQRRGDKLPAAACSISHIRWALSIGEELPGERSQTWSPKERTGTGSRNPELPLLLLLWLVPAPTVRGKGQLAGFR